MSAGLQFWRGLARGLTASLDVYTPTEWVESRSDVEKMRGDWVRIGADFKAVIARAQAQTKP